MTTIETKPKIPSAADVRRVLLDFAEKTDNMRTDFLFGESDDSMDIADALDSNTNESAAQYFLMADAALCQARGFLKLAAMNMDAD